MLRENARLMISASTSPLDPIRVYFYRYYVSSYLKERGGRAKWPGPLEMETLRITVPVITRPLALCRAAPSCCGKMLV